MDYCQYSQISRWDTKVSMTNVSWTCRILCIKHYFDMLTFGKTPTHLSFKKNNQKTKLAVSTAVKGAPGEVQGHWLHWEKKDLQKVAETISVIVLSKLHIVDRAPGVRIRSRMSLSLWIKQNNILRNNTIHSKTKAIRFNQQMMLIYFFSFFL